jgi:hypothetical protein
MVEYILKIIENIYVEYEFRVTVTGQSNSLLCTGPSESRVRPWPYAYPAHNGSCTRMTQAMTLITSDQVSYHDPAVAANDLPTRARHPNRQHRTASSQPSGSPNKAINTSLPPIIYFLWTANARLENRRFRRIRTRILPTHPPSDLGKSRALPC